VDRKKTSTSNFGVGKRESHDASGFYDRFERLELSNDSAVPMPRVIENPFVVGDARNMSQLADGEVALVVTSPPYFAGKQYEEEIERDGIPSSYTEYLELLADVFSECKRVLEPGGRIAVNVANLGRKPYRSLAADVIGILQRLGLLLRGEVIWQKGEGASGSCAWGSYRSPANPVLRDLTERVIIASKGRFDRALSSKARRELGLPCEVTVSADEFMAATLDLWQIPPESAKRVHHPAPFPVGLPERLIHMYTYRNDLVIDPFLGSGSTLVAAHRLGRRYLGYDLDPAYVEIARHRVEVEAVEVVPPLQLFADDVEGAGRASEGTGPEPLASGDELGATRRVAEELITQAGFRVTKAKARMRNTGVVIDFLAEDMVGNSWLFDVSGGFTTTIGGLSRAETAWKALGRANVLARKFPTQKLVFLTTQLPKSGTEGDVALRAAGPDAFFDAIDLRSPSGFERLQAYATGKCEKALPGFWRI
jgi:DNA modification methylase